MELQIGSIWRSLSLKGSRLCGGLGSLPATARPFLGVSSNSFAYFLLFEREKPVRTRTGDLHNSPHLFPNSFHGCRARLRCLLITSSLNYLKESRCERGRPSQEERETSALGSDECLLGLFLFLKVTANEVYLSVKCCSLLFSLCNMSNPNWV